MRTLDSPSVDVTVDSPERRDSIASNASNNGSNFHSGLGETKHLMERLNIAQVKVKRLQRLEAALVDFFMEVMDRSENINASQPLEPESMFARGKRKEQFLKKAEGDPISLLNALRTHLRLKFAEQEAQEAATERRSLAENLTNQQKTAGHSRKNFSSLNSHLRTRRQQQTLLEKMNVELQEKRSRVEEAQQLIAKQRQEITVLQEARDTLIKAAQIQKSLDGIGSTGATTGNTADSAAATPSATTAAVSAAGASPSHTNGDFFGTPAENQALRRALRKYELKMAHTEAVNEERKREVQRLQQQLTGLRQSTQFQMYSRLEKESRHLRELADDLKKRLVESEADLLRTKGALKERESHMQKMRDEYARFFNAVQKQKQPTHYSPSKLGRTPSAMQLAAISQGNRSPQLPSRGTIMDAHSESSTAATNANSEHPYVVEHYRSEAARADRGSEALKLQIRRMMASEQLHKQKTRVLRAEKQNLIRERDQLRADLDHAKRYNTLQSIAMNRQQSQPSVENRKMGYTGVPQDVKLLQKRNAFLEERFRKSLQSNSALTTIGAVARLRNSISVPSGFDSADPAVIHEADSESTVAGHHDPPLQRHHPMFITKSRPASANTTVKKDSGGSFRTITKQDNVGSFRSLDTSTLQSLQQVKRATRLTRSMDGSFDGIDGPQHERVAKALEQVNGFRYRYHPPPQDDKKMLRFDSDDEEDLSDGEGDEDEISGDETQRHQRRRSSNEKAKHKNGNPDVPIMTLDDHIEKLLRTTRTLAMMKIANNTAGTIPSDSEDDSDEADDVVSDELSIGSLSSVGSPKHGASSGKLTSLGSLSLAGTPKHGASSGKLSSLGSNSSMGGRKSSLLGTAAMRLARTLSAFLCLPRAISYVDLEAITEKLLESPNDQFDDGEYADLIDCHVDSARDDEAHTETDEDDPIWKRRNSRPIRPLNLAEDPTDLELVGISLFLSVISPSLMFLLGTCSINGKYSQRQITLVASRVAMYFGVSLSGRLLGSTMNGSSTSLNFGRQGSGSTVASNPSIDEAAADIADSPFNEEEYVKWRTQVKDDYLAWLNAKVEARKRRKSRMKKVDPSKKPRWLLLYEASKNPTQKYRPDEKE
ncbi:hypothetical protein ON010_g8021 [Phytophthora cinnamomi]|nr:hypothetical protein ON010_g8021 [Phytophthora cinnamomi]